jgi:hypothetical protein
MQPQKVPQAILLELGADDWEDQIDKVERWLGNVVLVQTTFRELVEAAVPKVREPNVRDYLRDVATRAREHEQKAEDLFRTIGRNPPDARTVSGLGTAKAHEALADLDAILDGAAGPWRDLHQILLAGISTMGAFATAEQLGLALGIPTLVEIAFQVVTEKSVQQMVLQEYLLELGTTSILYGARV